jgi:mono/diheme cytochrome c family protein
MNSRIVVGLLAAALGMALARTSAQAHDSSVVYDANCAICHQKAGAGVPGAFPHLAGRAGALAALPTGRVAMISTVLFGMSGRLQVDGQPVVGLMPSFGQLSNAEIVQALNYVAHLDGRTLRPFTVAEVAAVRAGSTLSPSQVNALARDPALAKAAP